MINKPPILITGIPRSGTSMVTGIIYLSGAFVGDTYKGNRFNPKGMFENKIIQTELIKPYLKNRGYDPKGQSILPDTNNLDTPNNWKYLVEKAFINQGYLDGEWAIKGAKIALMWNVWNNAFPDAKWIIVRRNEDNIINSCLRTSFMNAFNNYKDWEKWINQYKNYFKEMYENNLNIYEINSDKIISGDYGQLIQVVNLLNLNYNENEIKDFVDNNLFHFKS